VKVRISQESLESFKGVLKWAERALLIAAAVLLGYCAFAIWDAWRYQEQQGLHLDQLPPEEPAASIATPGLEPLTSPEALRYSDDELVGRIEIARLGLSVIVAEGISSKTLRRAAGHIPGTALPGEGSNVGIAGHRDTFFRPLEGIRVDDIIVLTTRAGEYRYRVVSSKVVSPNDVAVLDPTGSDVLTLVTCHPFYYVGSAPNRFIVRAARV